MFDISQVIPLFTARSQARALEMWRDSARVVALRWRDFLSAGSAERAGAFAAYVAALDAEEAAATELAVVSDEIAA